MEVEFIRAGNATVVYKCLICGKDVTEHDYIIMRTDLGDYTMTFRSIHEKCFLLTVDGAANYFEQEERKENEREQGKQGNPEDRPN